MRNNNYYLIINLGLKSVRAIIFDEAGNKYLQESLPINTIIKANEIEQDANEWWEKLVSVTRKVTIDQEIRKNIEYIAVTCSSGCLVSLDKNGNPVGNVLMVSDKRAGKEADEIKETAEFQKLKEKYDYEIGSYYLLPKLLWLKKNSNKFDQISQVTTPNGFFLGRIVGKSVIDLFDGEKFYYQKDAGYPKELINKCGLEHISFPDVKMLCDDLGTITREASEELGLESDVKVVLCSYDAICAFYGSGVSKNGDCCDVSGTVTSIRVLSNNVQSDTKKNGIFVQSIGNHHIIGGSNNLGGGVIEWLKQCFFQNETYPYEAMEAEIKNTEIGSKGLIFLPYLFGERAPIWNDLARGVFFGIERTHGRPEFTMAVFEGIAYTVKTIVEAIGKSNVEINRVMVSGGLARIHVINQIKADILGKEVYVVQEYETTAVGAMMMVAVTAGVYKDLMEASLKIVKYRAIIFPNQDNHMLYQKYFLLFSDLYEALVPMFKKRYETTSAFSKNIAKEITNL